MEKKNVNLELRPSVEKAMKHVLKEEEINQSFNIFKEYMNDEGNLELWDIRKTLKSI
jgi:hypothetical protein